FGYWKDTSVMIKGDAVWNLTMMFLQMWEVIGREGRSEYRQYLPHRYRTERYQSEGFVIAYGDSPLDDEDVGEISYMNILNTAVDYVYISTPYLILDEELLDALTFAAKRGVDVRIMVPGIPDKPYVKIMGESYFGELMRKGVKIYEFNGFNHAKMFVSDDRKAIVGTINLDYRSLYLHFENACFMYDMPAVKDIRADFEKMFGSECREVTPEDLRNRSRLRRFTAAMLKILEPML
ncbi:MAG: cardiolipin synthase, partial [Ruminococcus sp.]|nr:cardiolipin synthase [Ruminococcus sp.]